VVFEKGENMKKGLRLSKEEAILCLVAIDEYIRKWENLGNRVGRSWYNLRKKIQKFSEKL